MGACSGSERGPKVRHIVLITLDTTRADQLGCYGNPAVQTPALDQLASEGVRFASCASAASTTLASHASLLTGTYPHRHGVPRNGFTLSERARTLAEALDEAGFWCAGFLGSAALTGRTGIDQGFVHWDEDFDEAAREDGNDQSQRDAVTLTDRILAHTEETLARAGASDARLFLFAQYFDPHAPYAPPESELERYGARLRVGDFAAIEAAVVQQQVRALGRSAGGQQGVITGGLSEELIRNAPGVPTDTGRQLERLYRGEVTHMDREIGRLLLGLQRLGVLEDALVVITADHGETFWDGPNAWNHGLWVGQPEVSVPLIVRGPREAGLGSGLVVETPVSGVDVMPTVLELAGVSAGDVVLDGRSLGAAVRGGGSLADRAVFSEATQPGAALEAPELRWRGERKPVAVRLGRWKLVRAGYLGLEMLFDLSVDPAEREDRLLGGGDEEARAAAERLGGELARWRAEAAPLPSAFDREQAEGLAGLGYAEALQDVEDDR
ncbi:MAG: sulfatase [Planctomycetota bacterium]|nr:sulfatase [Planctomycetota bacterium]